jgi:hypothetical protein
MCFVRSFVGRSSIGLGTFYPPSRFAIRQAPYRGPSARGALARLLPGLRPSLNSSRPFGPTFG